MPDNLKPHRVHRLRKCVDGSLSAKAGSITVHGNDLFLRLRFDDLE